MAFNGLASIGKKKRKSIKQLAIEKKRKDEKEERDRLATERKNKYEYPPVIATILKRLRHIDPWHGIASMEPHNVALICYFKLKQNEMDELRIGVNSEHAWVEFFYDEKWWIFDPIAVRELELGDPIKQKIDAVEDKYKKMTRYFTSLDDYLKVYDKFISYTKDEARLKAMKDVGLSSALNIKYH